MKKLLSVLLALTLMLTLLPMGILSVSAATSGTTGDCTWTLDGTTLTISGNGRMESYGYYFDDRAPWGTSITTVIIQDGVTSIGSCAFSNSRLKMITIPNSVTDIGGSAFRSCTFLPSITIPNSVTDISSDAFYKCGMLVSVYLGEGVETIQRGAFEECTRLRSIVMTNSVKYIGNDAFYNCEMLTRVLFVGTDNEWYNISVGSGNDNFLNSRILHAHTGHATCTTAANCSECGYTFAQATGHSYTTVTTKATLKKDGSKVTKCALCGTQASKSTIKKIKSVKLSADSYTYNGKAKSPSVVVKDSAGKTLKKNTDYTVTYAKGRKNVGTYKVTVTFKGNYSGKKALTFKINPPKTAVSKVAAAKKSLKVTISKKTTQVTGYEVQYATSKSFKSAKTKAVKSAKTTSLTIKSLKAKKTYYVRVRTYKTVSGKKYYSAWSAVKSKKTK